MCPSLARDSAKILVVFVTMACGARQEEVEGSVTSSAETESPDAVDTVNGATLSIAKVASAGGTTISLTLTNAGTLPVYYYGDQGVLIPDREKFTPVGCWFMDPILSCGTGCGIHVLKPGDSTSVDVTSMTRKDVVTRFSVRLYMTEDGGESFLLKSGPILLQ